MQQEMGSEVPYTVDIIKAGFDKDRGGLRRLNSFPSYG
jgi:hypothetical protein